MAYQSIGQLNTKVQPSINYVPRVVTPKFNIGSVKDVPTLNTALHAGQINSNQWMQRFKQLQPKAPQIKTGIAAVPSSLGDALNKVLVKPVESVARTIPSTVKNTVNAAGQIGPDAAIIGSNVINKAIGRTPVTATQLKNIKTSNVGKTAKTFGATGSKKQLAGDVAQTALLAASPEMDAVGEKVAGKVLPKVISKVTGRTAANAAVGYGFGASQAASQGKNFKQINKAGVQNAILGGGLTAGGSALEKGISKSGAGAALGKDEATNALINSQKIANASKKTTLADRLGSPAVQEATTPKTTPISVVDKSAPVTGKVTTKADSAYIKASNKLSNQYEKELANVQSVSHPVTQKVLQDKLDTKYNALQQNLDDSYGKRSVSFKGNPVKSADSGITTPRSALTKNPVIPFDSTRIPEQNTNELPSPAPTKTTSPTGVEQKTGETPVEQGTKISGSSLNSEQRAVEKGLTSDLGEKATYSGGSYKQEASKAVSLANDNPDEAMKIATGAKPGDNVIHEVAVRRAVENKALQNGDVDTLSRLAQSSQHSATSEAAQRLGSESFNAVHNSPVQAIRDIQESRQKALLSKGEKTPEKALASTVKDIQKTAAPKLKVSRQDWHSFIQDLQCK